MLSRVRKHTSLISKLILSGALIAVSLAYGWWQRHHAAASPMASPMPTSTDAGVTTAAPPITAMAMLRMYQPPTPQPPLALVTGRPDAGATAPIPAGMHLADGDYLSEIEKYEWGDLQVKLSIQGGEIRAAVLTLYPDHRTESLDISKRAAPILNSEVIKTQGAKVDVVSAATDTSHAFRDAVAGVLKQAARPE